MIATIAGVGIAAMPSLRWKVACLLACEGRNHFLATYFDDYTQNEGVGLWDVSGTVPSVSGTCDVSGPS